MERIALFNEDNLELMKRLPDDSVDVICIDPPYLYLKNQKLERPFDELKFFSECARLLTKNGFIVMFGRGESFYRWNTLLENTRLYQGKYVYVEKRVTISNNVDVKENLYYNSVDISGNKDFKKVFTFKEEIVWNKSMGTSPLSKLCRVHETIAIFSKGDAAINKIKVPYLESKNFDLEKIQVDINRINSSLGKPESIQFLKDFIEGNRSDMELNTRFTKHKVTSDIRKSGAREVNTLASIQNGITEKSIINVVREHYNTIHPTQKPVRLLERLLKLVLPMKSKKIVIADFFSGSASCGEAVINLQSEFPDIDFEFIGCEIDEEYFNAGKERIEKLQPKQPELFEN
ncbi:site-specific DNA-methyltransferase [Chryseobacterium sp. SSA4.19]|uniref:DNA methyltransferase n=1 Tax=Chryseobacterium sp. SSA4.19 TaxID=2919915 RepID=UPI001F4E4CAA|nr:DNA methyltransferase [Chryseobacterium sp. SSA4.19]MCJ8153225.1 site-specific DNA-methyltransferase [Chryseobacterium sp. SSA4.19]